MHFFGINVVIICKSFEVVKSSIIILMADCNKYLHTSSKKNKFGNFISFGEKKGGGQVPKKSKTLGQQKFLAKCGGRRVQKSAELQFRPYCTPILKEF
jgi:hypothetical protein